MCAIVLIRVCVCVDGTTRVGLLTRQAAACSRLLNKSWIENHPSIDLY